MNYNYNYMLNYSGQLQWQIETLQSYASERPQYMPKAIPQSII